MIVQLFLLINTVLDEEVEDIKVKRMDIKRTITESMVNEDGYGRRDPEEEYFRLVIYSLNIYIQTVLAVKMIHNELDNEFVYDVI